MKIPLNELLKDYNEVAKIKEQKKTYFFRDLRKNSTLKVQKNLIYIHKSLWHTLWSGNTTDLFF